MFFAFAFVGYLWETGLKLVQTGNLVNSGALVGPWLPIYGFGGLAVIILLKKFKKNPLHVFALSLVTCTFLEYLCSYYLEFLKGVRYWDYSNYFINIDGRICFESAILFGLAGCFIMYIGEPIVTKLFKKIPKDFRVWLCVILCLAFFADNIYSTIHPHKGEGITYSEKAKESA